ncbi:hypothetical protein JCM10212_002504 [Sporobolomyces blumeae]
MNQGIAQVQAAGRTAVVDPTSLRSTRDHRVLSAYYPHLVPLRSLFSTTENDGRAIVREKDSDNFVNFLDQTLVASHDAAKDPPMLNVLEHDEDTIGMTEILHQVLQRIFAAHSVQYRLAKNEGRPAFTTPPNVLAGGYRLVAYDQRNLKTMTTIGTGPAYENVFTNTVASDLTASREWRTLLSRVGPDAVIKLLSAPHLALFQPLPNNCYLQISGRLVSDLPLPSTTTASNGKGRKVHVKSETKQKTRNRGRRRGRRGDRVDTSEDTGPSPAIEPSPTEGSAQARAGAEPAPAAAPPIASTSSRPLGPSRSATAGPGWVKSPLKRSISLLVEGTTVATQARRKVGDAVKPLTGRSRKRRKLDKVNTNNDIVLARHRLYHARITKPKQGGRFHGFSDKHILSRLSSLFTLPPSAALPRPELPPADLAKVLAPARHLAKYVFPREFDLHNVFDSEKENVWVEVKTDYQDRETEIKKLGPTKTPNRVKAVLPHLNRLAVLHTRCNYRKLLDLKCPRKTVRRKLDEQEKSLVLDLMSEPRTQTSRSNISLSLDATPRSSLLSTFGTPSSKNRRKSEVLPIGGTQARDKAESKPKLAEYACSFYEVESYVLAVVRDVIPRALWGSEANAKLISKYITQFVRMRRFETITLHSLLRGFSILSCEWLAPKPATTSESGPKGAALTDLEKRKELVGEFLFWFFDSFLTELIRTTFYVTDSATHHNRPLYFRHDDWTALTAPLLQSLGKTVFEKIPDHELIALERQPRELGFSYVRLLPKEAGVRPIVNLARRPLKLGLNGQLEVGQPINRILRSVFDVLNFEKSRKPHLVGSLLSNPQEIFEKLKGYKSKLLASSPDGTLAKLYFVKVDVKACFDTIKQGKLLEIVDNILCEALYYVQKYSQVLTYSGKMARQFKRKACGDDDLGSFKQLAMDLAEKLHDVVLADQIRYENVERAKLMSLLEEHITTNLVKVNGRLYRQKDGIPQGSILSSLLCSLFYGDMENTHLGFTRDLESLLTRYVDDFMFVTTKKHLAVRFLRVMNQGIPEYGCAISAEKRLTNFDIALEDGELVPPLVDGKGFPYCGLVVDTKTLDIRMNLELQLEKEIVNQLTVQRYRSPGKAFLEAMMRHVEALYLRSHAMYTDTSYNSLDTVYANIYESMLVVALKFEAYVRAWSSKVKGRAAFYWSTVKKIVEYEYSAVRYQSRKRAAASTALAKPSVLWLGYHAFHRVVSRNPAKFSPLVRHLTPELRRLRVPSADKALLKKATGAANQGEAAKSTRRE